MSIIYQLYWGLITFEHCQPTLWVCLHVWGLHKNFTAKYILLLLLLLFVIFHLPPKSEYLGNLHTIYGENPTGSVKSDIDWQLSPHHCMAMNQYCTYSRNICLITFFFFFICHEDRMKKSVSNKWGVKNVCTCGYVRNYRALNKVSGKACRLSRALFVDGVFTLYSAKWNFVPRREREWNWDGTGIASVYPKTDGAAANIARGYTLPPPPAPFPTLFPRVPCRTPRWAILILPTRGRIFQTRIYIHTQASDPTIYGSLRSPPALTPTSL